ncbi:bacteriohemerythrin [Acinetobacter sp.]|uniref:bacteriohemerythrin n=1 Tax=Acinetobacter sp. TaxID=472 RepID=UPI0031DC7DF1
MEWQNSFNIGIDVIDAQHRQILEYINILEDILQTHDQSKTADVLNDLIDYTQSHFTFEENLQQQVHYEYATPHKCIHDLFISKLALYQTRFNEGKLIDKDLHNFLSKWLINHIQHDDMDYVDAVRDNMLSYIRQQEAKKGRGWFSRFFKK